MMKGIIGAVGLVACYAGVSTMETAFLPGIIVALAGLAMLCGGIRTTN